MELDCTLSPFFFFIFKTSLYSSSFIALSKSYLEGKEEEEELFGFVLLLVVPLCVS
jgi:hypothetical protein